MLIRTQNKEALIDISGMTIKLDPEDKNTIITYSNHNDVNSFEILGVYSSKEKAKKVLDMIQDEYINSSYYWSGYTTKNTVFNIPTDEEVDV